MAEVSRVRQLAAALQGDGCTASPDLFYRECCDEHDVYYRTGRDLGGEPITRAEADRRLRACMKRAGKTLIVGRWLLPWCYYGAVRLFGGAAWRGA